ncbi:MAG: PIN domain-containing protein [Candidatus Brocadia sp.]|nr:PIN domain-containing protein [Candidatus Brocadia sp.]NUO09650.1 type II toxin-antitoxin system VapC family toxin [Candidatus Brocadia sp.]
MKYFIDTNIFLEIILDQGKSREARAFLSKIENHEFFMSDFSLHSIGILLFQQKQHAIFQLFLKDMIFNTVVVIISLSINDMPAVSNVSQRFNIDFDDAYQYVIAEKYGLTIISFDSDFDRTERGRITPAKVLKGENM